MTTFLLSAKSTSARSTGLLLVVIETLMTWAPSSAASRIPWARVAELLLCWVWVNTLTERIFASGATPSNGLPCACTLAAMMPAIAVPWPSPEQSWNPVPVRSMAVTLPASCGLPSTPLSTTATFMPLPSVSGHTLLQSSACWAQGTDLTFEVTWFESPHCWLGPGSVATGTGSDGVAGGFGFDGLDVGFAPGLAATALADPTARVGPTAEPAAAAAGAWAAATRTRPAAQTAIRLISAASVNRHISRI